MALSRDHLRTKGQAPTTPPKPTPRQAKLAQLTLQHPEWTLLQRWEAAGWKSRTKKEAVRVALAKKAHLRPGYLAELARLRAPIEKQARLSLAEYLEELREAADIAMRLGQMRAAIEAIHLRGDAMGHHPKNVNVRGAIGVVPLGVTPTQAFLADMLGELAPQLVGSGSTDPHNGAQNPELRQPIVVIEQDGKAADQGGAVGSSGDRAGRVLPAVRGGGGKAASAAPEQGPGQDVGREQRGGPLSERLRAGGGAG